MKKESKILFWKLLFWFHSLPLFSKHFCPYYAIVRTFGIIHHTDTQTLLSSKRDLIFATKKNLQILLFWMTSFMHCFYQMPPTFLKIVYNFPFEFDCGSDFSWSWRPTNYLGLNHLYLWISNKKSSLELHKIPKP